MTARKQLGANGGGFFGANSAHPFENPTPLSNFVQLLALLPTALTGLFYPLAVTGMAQVVFPAQANGSLVIADGRVAGSALIGQSFDDPAYFWGRPSATDYGALPGSGSNLGPSNPALLEAVQTRVAALHAADPGNLAPVPVDLVTMSASGLDPHISLAAALYQAPRVARARGLDAATVEALVLAQLEGRWAGMLGEPRLNVLRLNLALNALE